MDRHTIEEVGVPAPVLMEIAGRALAEDLLSLSVGDVMTNDPKTIKPLALAAEAVAIMNDLQITNLFVVGEDANRPVGIVHIHDLLKAGIT